MPRIKLKRLMIIMLCLFTITTLLIACSNIFLVEDSFDEKQNNLTVDGTLNNHKSTGDSSGQTDSDSNKSRINSTNIRVGNNNSKHSVSYQLSATEEKPWFMANGTIRPTHLMPSMAIWPEELPNDDRIVNQLMYIPMDYMKDKKRINLKTILLHSYDKDWKDLPMGQTKFLADKCPVNRCLLTDNKAEAERVDAIIFNHLFYLPEHKRRQNQIWILFSLESSRHTKLSKSDVGYGVINWTATYRRDADIVTPYEKFVRYHQRVIGKASADTAKQARNYAEGKNKKVAWFVSNCYARNRRLEYARELSKYIEVDIFGSCGNKKCLRSQSKQCLELLNKHYKFYLAFENSNCRDYITEKFYVNGLGHNSREHNIIPIVMGANQNDYKRSAPNHSYIHVDQFESAETLANYLHVLDTNDSLYNEYFHWKSSGEFINTYFWCRVCALLHAPQKSRFYANISNWWSPDGICSGVKQKKNDTKRSIFQSVISIFVIRFIQYLFSMLT